MKNDLREKLDAIFAMSKAKLKLVYPDEHPSTHDKLHIANVTLEGLDEMIALSVEEIEALFVALLDEVENKLLDNSIGLMNEEAAVKWDDVVSALQAIRDSVSGGKK